MAVVPSGRFTKEGKPIFKATPTQADVRREVSEQRVQTFGPGGRKISDTGRVKVTVGGEEKFVTPERALAIGSEAQKEEAKGKIKRRQELESTIRARFEREVEEARTKTQRKIIEKKGVKLVEVEKEETKPISRLKTFSPAARERLGLTETPEGLLEVETEGDRKIIVTGRKEPTIIPKSAEFKTGFEGQLGVREQDETRGLGGRFAQFKAIGTQDIPIISDVSKDIGRKITDIEILTETKIQPKIEKAAETLVPISFFEIQRAVTKVKLEQLEGKEGKVATAQRIALQSQEFGLGIPSGIFKQFREQPIQSGLIFLGGGVASKLVTGLGKIPIASKILGTTFVVGVGAEAGIKISRGDFGGAGEVIGERVTEAGLFIGGTQLGGTISQRISPKQIRVLKVKDRVGEFAERLRIGEGKAETLERLKFETEYKTQKLQTNVKETNKKISDKNGKTVAKL